MVVVVVVAVGLGILVEILGDTDDWMGEYGVGLEIFLLDTEEMHDLEETSGDVVMENLVLHGYLHAKMHHLSWNRIQF